MRFEVFPESPFEIVLYSRFLGCIPAEKFSYIDMKCARNFLSLVLNGRYCSPKFVNQATFHSTFPISVKTISDLVCYQVRVD